MAGDGVLHKHDHEAEINCPAKTFYNMFKTDILNIPKIAPEIFKSVQVLEGDGTSLGTVRLWKYVLADEPNKILTVKEKLEALDDETMSITFRVLEGDILEHYKSFATKLIITPNGEGCIVKWSLEHEKKHEASPDPHSHVSMFGALTGHCHGHLNKA